MNSPEIVNFVKHVKRQCRIDGVKVSFVRSKQVEASVGIRCFGYFDGKIISIAVKNYLWLSVLVHEFSHFLQWREQCSEWITEDKFGNRELEHWLRGKEVKNIKRAINNIISLELDCEKRALKLIAQHDLPINTATYIQRANECLFYYKYIEETRKWDNSLEESYNNMPSRFMSDSYYKKSLPDKYRKIFINHTVK